MMPDKSTRLELPPDGEVLISLPLEGASVFHGTLRLRLAGWEADGRPIVGLKQIPRSVKVRRKRRGFDKKPE